MKKLISLTIWLVFLAWSSVWAQSNNIDSTLTSTGFYATRLTGAIDTLDIENGGRVRYNFITITANSSVVDTLQVWTLCRDGSTWVQHGLIDLSSNTAVTSAALTTAFKEFLLLDPQPLKIRIISPSDDGSTDNVIISGKQGVLGR